MPELNEFLSDERKEMMKERLEKIVNRFGQLSKKDQDSIFLIRKKIFDKHQISKSDYQNVFDVFARYFY